jgi:hypothetical protein
MTHQIHSFLYESDQHSASTAGLYAHREQQKKIDEQSDKSTKKNVFMDYMN